MAATGDTAPDFTAKLARDDPEDFTLSEHLDDAPIVLAFFPGAFTPPCTNEMVAFQDDLDRYTQAGGTLYGVSADSAFSQKAFRDEYDLDFDLISDMDGEIIDSYGLGIDIADLGLYGISNRAVFVINSEGEIAYSWVADDPTNEPDYDELEDAIEAAA
jgi:glutaredoxin-dependent peroxiredoxin